jgi:hypothetical protein
LRIDHRPHPAEEAFQPAIVAELRARADFPGL